VPPRATTPVVREREDHSARIEAWVAVCGLILLSLLPSFSKFSGIQPGGVPTGELQGTEEPAGSSVDQILWTLLYFAAVARMFTLGDRTRRLFRHSIALIAFVLLTLLSTFWSVVPIVTLKESIELIGTTMIGYYFVARFELPKFLELLGIAFGALAVMSVVLIVVSPGLGLDAENGGDWSGVYAEKNGLGAAMALALITLIVVVMRTRGRRRLLFSSFLVLCAVLIIGSRSVTASAVLLATLLVVFDVYLCQSKRFGAVTRLATVIIVVLVPLVLAVTGAGPDTFFTLVGKDSNLTGRTDFWPALVQAIGDRPWLGYGYNAFFAPDGAWHQYLGILVTYWQWQPFHAHESFLQVALDVGLIGATLLAIVLVLGFAKAAIYTARDRSAVNVWPLAIIALLTFGSFTETYLTMDNTIEWILFTTALLYPVRDSLRREAVPPSRSLRLSTRRRRDRPDV